MHAVFCTSKDAKNCKYKKEVQIQGWLACWVYLANTLFWTPMLLCGYFFL